MELEKNPKTRPLYRQLLRLGDKATGIAFPTMRRDKQLNSYFCGPAVLVALFSFLGVKTSQTGIVRSLRVRKKIREYGLSIRDMARATRIIGKGAFSFWRKRNASSGDLDLIVNRHKYPVGVEWWGLFYEFEDDDSGHYGVVTRVDRPSGYLRLADFFWAFSGVDRKIKIRNFVRRWWDENEINGRVIKDKRMMFVITPKAETWPRELKMRKYSI